MMRLWIVMRNPPDQTRLHAVLAPHFVARRLDAPVAAARATARAAIAQMPAGQRFELLARVLIPSAQAAADTFLNVSHRDGVRLSQLSHRADRFVDQDVDPLTTAAGVMAHVGLVEMLATLLKQPARQSSELVAGLQRAAATGKISEREAVANLLLIAIAAYVNVSRQLANCIAALLTDPAQWPLLAAAPQRAAVALEEATRYESTTLTILRRARTDTQIGAQPIRSGELVMLGAAAANRDPALHADPDRLDLNRPSVRHWTFGAGMHFCLGAALSRQVGRVVLEELAVALPALTLAAPVRYEPSYIKRIPAELWVVGCAP